MCEYTLLFARSCGTATNSGIYNSTFCPNTTDDKERDEILHQKISIFRWIREKHLDIPETEHNESFLSFAESGTFYSINEMLCDINPFC